MRKVTDRPELVENNIELSVRHLKQYFKFGHGPNALKTKAVHDVSFDIKKGECFGVVGESGCGKTTTGRSLIKLYKITSGSIYFKGYRISGGTRWNVKEIKWTRINGQKKIKELNKSANEEIENIKDKTGLIISIREIDQNIQDLNKKTKDIKAIYKDKISEANLIEDEEQCIALKKGAKEEYANALKDIVSQIESLKAKRKQLNVTYQNQFKDPSYKLSDEDLNKINEINANKDKEIQEIKKHIKYTRSVQTENIKQIKYDNAHVDKKMVSKMQMIFQDPVDSLDPRMTVEDIIQEGLQIQGFKYRYQTSLKVKEVLEKVGLLPEYSSRYPHEFSGGQRQRIGIARALVMNPDFLIWDEPISALDVSIRAQIINLLNDLKEEMGLTIMFIAHDLSVVKYFCDRIAVMYYGQIVELASSDELFKHPLHPYTEALLSAIPKPDPLAERERQRYVYDPNKEHDYSIEKPTLTEIIPGHFVLANSTELEKYKDKIKELDK